jgi:hypothetical protein
MVQLVNPKALYPLLCNTGVPVEGLLTCSDDLGNFVME